MQEQGFDELQEALQEQHQQELRLLQMQVQNSQQNLSPHSQFSEQDHHKVYYCQEEQIIEPGRQDQSLHNAQHQKSACISMYQQGQYIVAEQYNQSIKTDKIRLKKWECDMIRKQIQFYLSPANILDDHHLRTQLLGNQHTNKHTKGNWIALSYFLKCNKIKQILAHQILQQSDDKNDHQYEIQDGGWSHRSLVRMLAKIMKKSDKLIVMHNRVKTTLPYLIKRQKLRQDKEQNKEKTNKKSNNIEISNKQKSRMIYLEFRQQSKAETIINKLSQFTHIFNNEKSSKDEALLSFKISQRSMKWILIICGSVALRQLLQQKFSDKQLQNQLEITKVLDGQSWKNFQALSVKLQAQIKSYIKSQNVLNNCKHLMNQS